MKKNYLKTISQLAAAWACLVLATPGAVAQTAPGLRQPQGLMVPTTPANGVARISNKIQFHGQVGGTQMNTRFDPLDLCPNVVDPSTHGIQSQPYQFEFESNCSGNSNSWDCRFRPNFIWSIKYYTETGAVYTEQWQDVTSGDFSKIRLYMYDRVPYTLYSVTPTNGQATQAGGNTNFSAVPYPNLGCLQAPDNTAAHAGDLITHVQLECTGYSCGFTQGDDSDVIQIRYYGRRPDAIAVNGPTSLCRNTTYPISVSSVFAATNYVWYTAGLNGATIGAVNGTNATLDVSGVPAGTNTITLRVAAQDNAHCGGIISGTRELVVNLQPSPAASASMQLTGGVCPSTTTKFLAANPVTGASDYRWQLVGSNNPAGTYLVDRFGAHITTPGTPVTGVGYNLEIGTPTAGTVSVMVEAKTTDCEGYSPALTKSFQIGNIAPDPATGYTGPDRWCIGSPSTIYIDTKPGLSYYPINVFGAYAGNIQPAGAQVTNVTQTPAMVGSSEFMISIAPNSAGSYPTNFDLYVSVVSQCPGNTSGSQLCLLPVKVKNPVNCAVGCFRCPPETMRQTGGTSAAALYPNPATGEVKIELRPDTRYPWVKVMDAQGRVVLQRQSEAATGITGFDVKGLPTGLYQVQLFDGKKLTTQPLVKE